MNFIDIHAHLDFRDYDADRAAVIARTRAAGCGVINVGVDLATSKEVIKLAEENEMMWATVGAHPDSAEASPGKPEDAKGEVDWVEMEKLARHDKVVAIGECGLDYFRFDKQLGHSVSKLQERQKEVFGRQIELSLKVNKPLMLHVREAYDDVLAILKKYPGVRGNAHFFAGTWEQAKQFLDLGFTLSFTGVITFASQYDEVIKNAPLDRIMAETDAPFVAPVPYRGKRNEPLYVAEVVKRIAEIKGIDPEVCQKQLTTNARQTFGLLL